MTSILLLKDHSGKREGYLGGGRCKHNGETRSEAIEEKLWRLDPKDVKVTNIEATSFYLSASSPKVYNKNVHESEQKSLTCLEGLNTFHLVISELSNIF